MKKYLKKIAVLCVIMVFIMPLSGCWDYTEMNDFKYVAGIAVDKDINTDEYILTLEVLEASINSKSIKSEIVQSRGKTIHFAFRDAIKNTGKMLQLSHAKIIMVSKSIAMEGIIPIVDMINRDVETRNNMWILVASTSKASDIFSNKKDVDKIMSYDISDAIKNANKTGEYTPIEVFKLMQRISNNGVSAETPMVGLVNKNGITNFQVDGTAVFKGERMVGELTPNETLILQILKGKNPKFVIPVSLPNSGTVSFEIMNLKRKIRLKEEEDKIVIDMYIEMNVSMSELAETQTNYLAKGKRKELTDQVEHCLKNRSNNLIEKLQYEYKSDLIGFGNEFKKRRPIRWQEVSKYWMREYENSKINVSIDLNIKYSGLTNKNIKVGD
ncbi:Ger(x)C family spore germination protein [Clostridium niameyense]|uniref:Ger(X)C family spore germination protein n=1 Tax=Clostridium niameyense TaxID=1622073 RepID=A0A6M0R6C2_9CLOT|nr:Ger(x)C family spore germination protein [Clostridium niameyense]NEZ45792.1 Ger(x)C family spore germination protein [Clostridium niameyense]